MGEGAIKDQEAFGFGSFRQMNKDAGAPPVKNFRRIRQPGMPGPDHLAQHARSGQQEIFCLSLFLVILFKTNKQKLHTIKLHLLWVSKTCSFFSCFLLF